MLCCLIYNNNTLYPRSLHHKRTRIPWLIPWKPETCCDFSD